MNGKALLLDGLRLRLDLRLASSSEAPRRELPFLSRASQQRAAAAGLATLLLALALWRWGTPGEPEASPPAPSVAPVVLAPLPRVEPAPRIEPAPVEPAPRLEPAPIETSPLPLRPASAAPATRAPTAHVTRSAPPAAAKASADAATVRTRPDRDLIDLFSDTK